MKEGAPPAGTVIMSGVFYQPHPNGGGLVAKTATVDSAVFVGPNAKVSGNARVRGRAQICDESEVTDNAVVAGSIRLYGKSLVGGQASIVSSAHHCETIFKNTKIE